MRASTRTPVLPLPTAQPDRSHATAMAEDLASDDGALAEPRAATRWASSPLLRATSPLTEGRRWNDPPVTKARR